MLVKLAGMPAWTETVFPVPQPVRASRIAKASSGRPILMSQPLFESQSGPMTEHRAAYRGRRERARQPGLLIRPRFCTVRLSCYRDSRTQNIAVQILTRWTNGSTSHAETQGDPLTQLDRRPVPAWPLVELIA